MPPVVEASNCCDGEHHAPSSMRAVNLNMLLVAAAMVAIVAIPVLILVGVMGIF